jgi:hypothetical protein
LRRLEIQFTVTYEAMEFPLKRIFHVGVPGRRFARFRPKVTNGIGSSQRQRNQVINFVVAGLLLGNSILSVRLSFKPSWHCSHLLRIARNANVLSGHIKNVTRRQLQIGNDWRGLLGEDDAGEKQQYRKDSNVHWGTFYSPRHPCAESLNLN